MKPLILFILPLFVICVSVYRADACLQPVGIILVKDKFNGDLIREYNNIENVAAKDIISYLTSPQEWEQWLNARDYFKQRQKDTPNLEYINNLAVALIHLGEVKKAIAILENLEKKYPGQYPVAANLGTAYELNGENQKALEWIKKGVERNPKSHFGTEWLHVKILEAKIAMEQDPEWLNNHSVLGADFGTGEKQDPSEISTTDYLGQKKSLTEIQDALGYQLHERLEFIKPPERVVADLLVDLSKALAILRTPEHAKAVNDLAVKYGAKPVNVLAVNPDPKPEEIQKSDKAQERSYLFYGIIGGVIALTVGVVFVFIRKRRYR